MLGKSIAAGAGGDSEDPATGPCDPVLGALRLALSAGMNLPDALSRVSTLPEVRHAAADLERCARALRSGIRGYAVARIVGSALPPATVWVLVASDAPSTGDLGRVAELLCEYEALERLERCAWRRVGIVLALAATMGFGFCLLSCWLLPQFEETLLLLGRSLPPLTDSMLKVGRHRHALTLAMATVGLLTLGAIFLAASRQNFVRVLRQLALRVPLLRGPASAALSARVAYLLAAALQRGTAPAEALEQVGRLLGLATAGSHSLRSAWEKRAPLGLLQTLGSWACLPGRELWMLERGGTAATAAESLAAAARRSAREFQQWARKLGGPLPAAAMLAIISGLAGTMAAAMVLALVDL
ncbi:MAG: hypothetical protein HYZ53_25550 [Planctomycetes bacterium]|nr:hypothetical protein [Planctomycetota bacterium]